MAIKTPTKKEETKMEKGRSWKDPYGKQNTEEREYREYVEGIQDGNYAKAWGGYCPRYSDKRTAKYIAGFKTATGYSPSKWDSL